MITPRRLCLLGLIGTFALTPFSSGCGGAEAASGSDDITDVNQTDVERQSIGNCWLYAAASWVESMNLSATGKPYDVSQSYWTYWHWYEQIMAGAGDEISTGGSFWIATSILRRRGVMAEKSFVKEDTTSEMSTRQAEALEKINYELKDGRLKDLASREDRAFVREVLDDAWGLTNSVKKKLTKVFGSSYERSFEDSPGPTKLTGIVSPNKFKVQYTERLTNPNGPTVKNTTLDIALDDWTEDNYPSNSWYGSLEKKRRAFLIRVQRALHDAQPVVISWDVDFNAMENFDPELKGSFNMTTLQNAGRPGRQGGHLTVLEDYEATTEEFGLLKAGETLDPNDAEDKARLDAALLPSTQIKFLRIKNSWGALRDDRASAPGFPGYHDLYMDYLNGPIPYCPDDPDETKTNENCTGRTNPFDNVLLPPGY